jgi:hypothetical protein
MKHIKTAAQKERHKSGNLNSLQVCAGDDGIRLLLSSIFSPES